MTRTTGLTTLREDDIGRHRDTAQSLITRFVQIEGGDAPRGTALAGTGRRFVSTVSAGPTRRSRAVTFAATLSALKPDDPLLSIGAHALMYRLRRGIAVALAVADVFARQTALEGLKERNAHTPLSGEDAARYRRLVEASAYVAAFSLSAYLLALTDAEGEPAGDTDEPDLLFDTPQEAIKSLVAGLDRAVSGTGDDADLAARTRAFARTAIEGLLARKARFADLAAFEDSHIRLDADNFVLDGFDVAPGAKRKPLVMTFKKPEEIIGNHIAKYQAVKLAKMLMAYDFDRQMNPFVELGGFLFTVIGDGLPGTGKTMLIQMTAGLLHDYCRMAGYPFHYENFGVDQISSYQGKSGQNCKAFVDNVLNPRAIGFGTIDDVDQVTARRADDRASAGQHEVTAVLMESFAGASTVVRGNCSFGMFSNHPENVDDALRQRAGARWLVDGPQSREDYIDIFALLAGGNHAIPLGDHDLYAGQQLRQAVTASYDGHERPKEDRLVAVWEQMERDGGMPRTLADIGAYLHRISQVEPRFTGRAVKNITDAVKMRAMDVDLPDDWFETPETFVHKPYDDKKAMIAALRRPFTIEMVLQEINRYGDSEFRYADRSDAAAVEEIIRRERQRARAARAIADQKAKGLWEA